MTHRPAKSEFPKAPPGGSLKRGLTVAAAATLIVAATMTARSFMPEEERRQLTYRIARGDLIVTVNEQGLLESKNNVEIKSKVRGWNTVLWIIESGSFVEQGDELVRLDSLSIQEQIDERTKYAFWSQSAADGSSARVARAELAVSEYEQGRFRTQVLSLEKELAVAEAALRNATDQLRHTKTMAQNGYIGELEVEESEFAVEQQRLALELKRTELDVLRNFTHKEQMQTLKGNLQSVAAKHKANTERAQADASRRDRAVEELDYCVIRAPQSGMVIHPNAAKWESSPIAEGTNVHKDQLLLLMPDLNQMQVKVGVHEDVVKRVQTGQAAKVVMSEGTLEGTVNEVASITKPAGWWTGNQVRYDTEISLPTQPWLRPGMSADVVVTVATHRDVLLIPVAAVVERSEQHFCWVAASAGPQRRAIQLGDSDNVFAIVESGLQEGDLVLLNTAAWETPATETDDTSADGTSADGTSEKAPKASVKESQSNSGATQKSTDISRSRTETAD